MSVIRRTPAFFFEQAQFHWKSHVIEILQRAADFRHVFFLPDGSSGLIERIHLQSSLFADVRESCSLCHLQISV